MSTSDKICGVFHRFYRVCFFFLRQLEKIAKCVSRSRFVPRKKQTKVYSPIDIVGEWVYDADEPKKGGMQSMISTKGRYALKVMVELAEHDAEEYIPLKGIAEKLNISQKYLESISTILSKGHMIEGVSGKKGGYRLNRKPEEYRVGDILRLTEGTLAPVSCLREDQEPCEKSDSCCTLPIWKGLADLIDKYFDEMTLADVLQSKQEAEKKAAEKENTEKTE